MKIKPFKLNKAQMIVMIQRVSSAVSIWSRGTGKSFFIAWIIHLVVKNMPRSCWAIVGKSYKQILTRTLPSTISALETFFGYKLGRDYFVRQKPPKNLRFESPFEPPIDYEHFIIFKNGTGFHLVSLDGGGGSIRGLNIDGWIADEGLEINKLKLDKEVSPTNRGRIRHFGHIPMHHGTFVFSSMGYGPEFKWILDKGEYYAEKGLNYRAIREEIVRKSLLMIDNKNTEYRVQKWKEIIALKNQLKWRKNKDGFLYSEADIFDNIENVGWKYIEQQRRDLADFIFLVEILNWFPEGVEEGFYPDLSREYHGYESKHNHSFISNLELDDDAMLNPDSRMDEDCVPSLPLQIAVDWGAKINSLTVTQYYKSINTIRFIKNIYVKHPKILDDLASEFCEYYKHHINKVVYMRYDHTGNKSEANSKITYADQFTQILKKNGWTVKIKRKLNPPRHRIKYLQWSRILKNTIDAKKGRPHDPSIPIIEFNLDNCNETFVSMSNAQVIEKQGNIQKDKSSERNPLLPQEEATHLSDTADMHIDDVNIVEIGMPDPIPNSYQN